MSRVLLVCNQFPKFSESFIVRKVLGLLRLGWDVHVACNRSDDEQWEHFASLMPRNHFADRVHLAQDFEKVVDDLRPAIVHFEFGQLARGRARVAALAGGRVVASLRGNDVNANGLDDPEFFTELWETLDGLHVLREALFVKAVERGCRADLPHVEIPPAVDAAFFRPSRRARVATGTRAQPLRVLSIGRLHWMKGYATALHAMASLRMLGISFEYRIAGAADYAEGKIETLFSIHDHGLEDAVELLGPVSQHDVREQLEWCDVLLHAAVSEGFCNAALEAQAMGVPVVCTEAIAGNVLDCRTGLVASNRDAEGLAARLAVLAREPRLRRVLGVAGRRRARQQFDLDTQLDCFSSWYRQLIATEHDGLETRIVRIRLRQATDQLRELEFERERLARDIERRESVEAVRNLMHEHIPEEETVLIVSRGDPALLELGRPAAHFPQTADGGYLGHHPSSSADAIAQLEELRAGGAAFLVFPRTGLWWLEHYRALREHLEQRYTPLVVDEGAGAIFELRTPVAIEREVA
jgi:colanic acid/amylovoran biosynthesis glycosyltransferase